MKTTNVKKVKKNVAKIEEAYNNADINGYIGACNSITKAFEKEPLFESMEEFDKLMNDDAPITF